MSSRLMKPNQKLTVAVEAGVAVAVVTEVEAVAVVTEVEAVAVTAGNRWKCIRYTDFIIRKFIENIVTEHRIRFDIPYIFNREINSLLVKKS
jgi:hypothetical protein